jgi:hypothetical protein
MLIITSLRGDRNLTEYGANDFRARSYDIFVSYKREDDDARAVLVAALEKVGYDVFWDAKLNHDDWKGELRDEINRSAIVICLWSRKAAASDNVKAEAFHAFGIRKLLSAHIEDRSCVPDYFKSTNLHAFDGWRDEGSRSGQLAKIVATLERTIGTPAPSSGAQAGGTIIPVEWGDIPGAPPKLVGRSDELAMLRAAWESAVPGKINAVVLHALGGAGKSALLRAFANELLTEGGRGAARIYGWSAYSQGSGEQKRADADSFIAKALADFGFAGNQPRDPVERARALAKLVQKERTLLLLDGLEPLQNPPNVNRGRFKDAGLAELVKILASQNAGLMVLTTRQEIVELEGHGGLVINHPLDRLSEAAGADLLVELGVHGRQRELVAAARAVDGHALSVTLLGTYLSEVCCGDVRHADQFDFANIVTSEAEDEELATDKTAKPARRAAKIMRGYLGIFDKLTESGPQTEVGTADRTLLNLLGLFDRPAEGSAIKMLLKAPIPGLTDELFFESATRCFGWGPFKHHRIVRREIGEDERLQRIRRAKERLRRLRLLSKPNQGDPHELDAHPIVRAFFAGRLKTIAPEATRAAHEILYRHYSATAPAMPTTLEEMQPLFHAVQHAAKGGRAEEAWTEIVQERMQQHYSFLLRSLGAFGPYLTCLSHFFDPPWRIVRDGLSREAQAQILGEAAYSLKSLGRLRDAVEPRSASMKLIIDNNQWDSASNLASSACQELLIMGNIEESIAMGEKSIEYCEKSNLLFIEFCISDYRFAQFHSSPSFELNLDKDPYLANLFRQPLRGFTGYQVGLFLLAKGDANAALKQGREQLLRSKFHLGLAFDHLLIALAQIALEDDQAATSLETSVIEFRKSGSIHHLPKSLIARAAYQRRLAAAGAHELVEKIREDLAEIEDIAGDEMRLYLTDLALERARLALDVPAAFPDAEAARAEAVTQTALAADLIAETGYHLRDGELAELRTRLQ